MSLMRIHVSKIFENQSAKTGKTWWAVMDATGTKYSVWDEMVRARLEEGKDYQCDIQEKGAFKNLTSVLPADFVVEDIPTTLSPSSAMRPSPAVAGAGKLHEELSLIITERMEAWEAACGLAEAKIILPQAISQWADRGLAYYHNSPEPAPIPNKLPDAFVEEL